MKQKLAILISLIIFTALPVPALAASDVDPLFNPNKLLDDKVFKDTQTFGGPAGIQKFLESKGSILANTSPDFIARLKEPNSSQLKQALDDPHASSGKMRSAAELIWDAAQSSGLNPQVIIVTLNKEQSLITGRQSSDSPEQIQRSLDFAMGFDCPVASGCGTLFPGFYFQLFGNLDTENNRYLGAAKSLMKSFDTPGGRGPAINGAISKIGDSITLDNTLGGYNGVQSHQTIVLSNAATAALYRYTPHVFNGNYNFFRFFNAWFRYPNGTLLKTGKKGTLYVIQNGAKQQVPEFVAQARGLNLSDALTVSETELDSYTTEKIYGPADNTIISVDGKLYVFLADIKHPASSFVISQRGLNPANAITVKEEDAKIFQDGSQLTPSDGTVLKGDGSAAIYLVESGMLKLFSPFTFAQRKAAASVKIIPQTEIDSYPKQGYVAPTNGTLVKGQSSGAVYLVDGGTLRPLTAELFRNNGFSFKNVAVLGDTELQTLPMGDFATPKNNTFFTTGAEFYLYKDGAKHLISSFVAAQKKLTPDFTFDAGIAAKWPTGVPIAPRDNTIIKGDKSPAVYLVQTGQLRPLTFAAFQARKITPKQISVLPQAEVDAYAKGELLEK